MANRKDFLPVSLSDLKERGIDELDFVFVSGDAYVDHPSFAAALLGRLLEKNGYTVGIIAQPDCSTAEGFKVLGRPKLAFLVSAGAMDSMVSNYTANNKPRSSDAYAHGGIAGNRPDRATIKYVAKIREAYKGVNVIVGGIEASLRRTSHYDYWSNTVRRSLLLDSKADLLLYGMGETSLVEVARLLESGVPAREIRGVRGSVWYTSKESELPLYEKAFGEKSLCGIAGAAKPFSQSENGATAEPRKARDPSDGMFNERTFVREKTSIQKIKTPLIAAKTKTDVALMLPSFGEIKGEDERSKNLFALSYLVQEQNTDAINSHVLIEPCDTRFVVQEKPCMPLTTEALDAVYALPFTRKWHPMYDVPAANGERGVPALSEVKFSLTSCRGCFGACSFCAITFHQGRRIQSRSHESLVEEAKALTQDSDFKGYIHDVGGPTANFRFDACSAQKERGACPNKDCMGVKPCANVRVDHSDYVSLLRKLREVPGVKKVFVRSGIRFDYLMMDRDKTFLRELCEHHISGQLKVAPEHVSDKVLSLMRKSTHAVYEKFSLEYERMNRELGKKQYLVPYYIAGHPGTGLGEALEVALYLKKTGFVPDQVQDFYPTPGSLATCMYWTGLDPHSMNEDGSFCKVYVPRGGHERRLQRALLQFSHKENKPLVIEALRALGRMDLVKVFYPR